MRIVDNITELLSQLEWIQEEVEKVEEDMLKNQFKNKIAVKKEYDLLMHGQSNNNGVDPWTHEVSSKVWNQFCGCCSEGSQP